MRCHQYCGGAADSVHRQSSGYPGCAREMMVLILWEACVCVLEAFDVSVPVAAILKEKLTLKSPDEFDTAGTNPDTGSTPVRTNSENASERLCSKFESVETPAIMSVTKCSLCFRRQSARRSGGYCEPLTSRIFSKLFMRCPLRPRLQ